MLRLNLLLFIYFFLNISIAGSENNPIIYITPYGSKDYNNTGNLQNQYLNLKKENITNLQNKQKIFNFSNQIDVDLSNGDYGHHDLKINGGDPNFTIISLDGLQLNNHANSRGGSFNLRDLSFKNIDQINFISGTNAQTLGSGAMSGFLNLNLGNAYFKDEQKINLDKSLDSQFLTNENKKNFDQFSTKNKISYFEKENTKTGENLSNVNLQKQNIFPLSHIIINSVVDSEQTLSFSLSILAMDIVSRSKLETTDIFEGNNNEQDVLNTQLAVLNKLIMVLRKGTLHRDQYQLVGDPSCEPFYDRFENELAGWTANLDVVIYNDITIC